jgi:hypothetical protein
MKKELIEQITDYKKVANKEIFVKFLMARFPNESDNITSYFEEWATRYNSGQPEKYMDFESLRVYKSIVGWSLNEHN